MSRLSVPVKSRPLALSSGTHLVPAPIADLGEQATWRYIDFFTANIRNPNTRWAYARASLPSSPALLEKLITIL